VHIASVQAEQEQVDDQGQNEVFAWVVYHSP